MKDARVTKIIDEIYYKFSDLPGMEKHDASEVCKRVREAVEGFFVLAKGSMEQSEYDEMVDTLYEKAASEKLTLDDLPDSLMDRLEEVNRELGATLKTQEDGVFSRTNTEVPFSNQARSQGKKAKRGRQIHR